MRTLVMVIALLVMAAATQAQTNPFGPRPRAGEGADSAARDAEAPAQPAIILPAPVRAVFRQVADWQRELNRFLSGKLRESRETGSNLAAIAVLVASFFYGVLHAAGPGHGKMVVASYFTAKRAPLKTGILMGSVIAATQAVVAILVVALLAVVIGRSQLQVMNDANWLELASYAIIFAMGAYMTFCALTGREAFAHDHGPAASTFDGPATAAHHDTHGHGHGAHGHDDHGHHHHGHHHDHGDARQSWLARLAGRMLGRDGEVIAVGIVSGVRPCSGSILVLLFALANGVFLLGIAAALFIAFGVAITISVLGIATIVLRRAITGGPTATSPWRAAASRGLQIAGSAGVMVMGALLLGGALELNGLI